LNEADAADATGRPAQRTYLFVVYGCTIAAPHVSEFAVKTAEVFHRANSFKQQELGSFFGTFSID
jgi:hypothetical protein